MRRVASVGENFCYMVYSIFDCFAYCVGLSHDEIATKSGLEVDPEKVNQSTNVAIPVMLFFLAIALAISVWALYQKVKGVGTKGGEDYAPLSDN